MSNSLRCSPEFRPALASLAAADETMSVLRARLAALPERQELSRLEQQQRKREKQKLERTKESRGHHQEVNRLRQEVGKLKERVRANVKSLRAEIDKEKRRDLKHDLTAAQTRLHAAEERLARELKVVEMFAGNQDEAGAGDLQQARDRVAQASRAIEADLAAAQSRAEAARAAICDSVLAAYDEQREAHGVGAAKLQGRTCQGCFMELDPAFMKQLRAAADDEVLRCPECGVLLLV